MGDLAITRNEPDRKTRSGHQLRCAVTHGDWNYVISPRAQAS
jgi:hypothetical protein